MERRVPDITKVKALTGYSPRVALEYALCLIRDWCIGEKDLEHTEAITCASFDNRQDESS